MSATRKSPGKRDSQPAAPAPARADAGDGATVGTFHWSAKEDRLEWSPELCLIAGQSLEHRPATLETMLGCVHPDERERARQCLDQALHDHEPFRLRTRLVRPDGAERVVECVGSVDVDDQGNATGVHGVCVDVTDAPVAESVENADTPFRMLVSQIKDYAIFMLDPSGNIVSWNEGARRIKGYSAEDIIGRSMSTFYTPDDAASGHPAELLRIARADGRVEEEGWRVRKDGSRFWADVVITALRDESGKLRGFGKVTRDLTERREGELALAELSARLLELQDDERRRISRELHDSTSPLLTGLMSRLHAARQRAKGDAGVSSLIDDAISSAEATTTVIRSVAALLHPPLLDESGLLASLRWYAKALSGRRDFKVELDFPPTLERFNHDVEIALFRMVQESLGNVFQILGARQARVQIRLKEGTLSLLIEAEDTPSGSLAELRSGRGDLGIAVAGMRERMRKLGGKLLLGSEGGRMSISISLSLADMPRASRG